MDVTWPLLEWQHWDQWESCLELWTSKTADQVQITRLTFKSKCSPYSTVPCHAVHLGRRSCLGKLSPLILNLSELGQVFQSFWLSGNLSKNESSYSQKALLLCSMKSTIETFTTCSLKRPLKEKLPSCVSFITIIAPFSSIQPEELVVSNMGCVCGGHTGPTSLHLLRPQGVRVLGTLSHSLCWWVWLHIPQGPSGTPCFPFSFAPNSCPFSLPRSHCCPHCSYAPASNTFLPLT